jgi:hypothetical protein
MAQKECSAHDLSTDAFDVGAVTTGAGLFARLKERTRTGYRGAAGLNHHRAHFRTIGNVSKIF